ncbi:NADH-quinone oxidoreductase subunit L [Flavihumibacter profundi]|uniref:NADH-quinone oxidoreductase subunit L n=1 Tax=Flavihumibacter profundi TaxID=2716883 RepID=UPI001CC731B0|nr:NADH-quinone oxidoreductase subunit L [Flavihumibacter profundi]MBZ5859464.1 NADH-quinone oxidoreductase subunit L [Flavihumibacter profundi]
MNNIIDYVWLVPLFPLVGFLLNGLLRNSLSKPLTGIIGSGSILASFVVSVLIFMQVKTGATGIVTLFDFISYDKTNIPFAFQVDQLSSLFLLIITGIGFLIHLYSTAYMHDETDMHFARYFAYLNLFVFSMLLLVLGANYVIMFIGWEGVGLCSYLLIGYWFKNIEYTSAAKKAFVMNRIGDLGFLLAVFWILSKLGTVTYSEVFEKVNLLSANDITIITLLLFVGATGKSAQIPLYTWLPDAMAGPTPVSALIHAATMVTAGIYMIARSNILYTMAPTTQAVVTIIGLATALFAATIALKQNDIKKVLAYSTVSQLGYMFLGLGVGAFTGAVFHVMTHAFFKALLFLGAGSVIHAMHHEQDIRNMGGLKKYLPITHITFLLGCLAIAGIPPFSGFFSKDEILAAAYAKNPILYVLGVAGALMTAFYMFRLYAMTFLGKFRGTHEQEHHLHESPAAMTIPLIVLAALSVVGGLVGIPEVLAHNAHALEEFLAPVFAKSTALAKPHEIPHSTELLMMGGVTALVLGIIAYAWGKFSKYEKSAEESAGFGKVLENKWYVDEIYEAVITKPVNAFGKLLAKVDKYGIDWVVNGVGRSVQYASRQVRLLQSGQVGNYVLLMVVGIIILFAIQIFLKK